MQRAAILFALLGAVLIGFQIALAAGAPWGAATVHGLYPGILPGAMRLAALAQAAVMAGFVAVVLSRAGLWLRFWPPSRWLIWVVAAFFVFNTVMNAISPSFAERLIWTPVAALGALAALIVARSRDPR